VSKHGTRNHLHLTLDPLGIIGLLQKIPLATLKKQTTLLSPKLSRFSFLLSLSPINMVNLPAITNNSARNLALIIIRFRICIRS